MFLAMDLSALLSSTEVIVGAAATIIFAIATILQTIGKKKWADKANDLAEVVEEYKDEAQKLADLVATLVAGIEKAKNVMRPKLGENEPNVGAIVSDHAFDVGMRTDLEEAVKRYVPPKK